MDFEICPFFLSLEASINLSAGKKMKSFKLSVIAAAAFLALSGTTQAADVEVYGLIDQGLKVTRDGGKIPSK